MTSWPWKLHLLYWKASCPPPKPLTLHLLWLKSLMPSPQTTDITFAMVEKPHVLPPNHWHYICYGWKASRPPPKPLTLHLLWLKSLMPSPQTTYITFAMVEKPHALPPNHWHYICYGWKASCPPPKPLTLHLLWLKSLMSSPQTLTFPLGLLMCYCLYFLDDGHDVDQDVDRDVVRMLIWCWLDGFQCCSVWYDVDHDVDRDVSQDVDQDVDMMLIRRFLVLLCLIWCWSRC